MKRLLVAALATLFLAAAPAAPAERVVERGIVQAIDRRSVVLRALDGTEVTVALRAETRFRLNGTDAVFGDLRAGFVAEAVLDGTGNTIVLRAFGTPERRVVRGLLVRQRLGALLVQRRGGRTVRIPVTASTAVWRNGARVRLRALRPGMLLQVERAADGSAATIRVLRRA